MDKEKPLTWQQTYSELYNKFQLEPEKMAKDLGMEEADFSETVRGNREPTEDESARFQEYYRDWFDRYCKSKEKPNPLINMPGKLDSPDPETDT